MNHRILANRQSAQRSRVRKLHYISELERNVQLLQVCTLDISINFSITYSITVLEIVCDCLL
jgi:bZIP transcription factor